MRTRLAQSLVCPRCTQHLTLTHDMCKSGPLQYFRCATDGGRLTPFFQFFREKDFLRRLTPAELQQVRVKIKQLQCSNCGAPVDLEHNTSCTYSGSPIAMIDADAIENALQVWVNRDTRERDAQARGDKLLEAMQQTSEGRPLFSTPAWSQNTDALTRAEGGSDLVQVCISALGDIFTSE